MNPINPTAVVKAPFDLQRIINPIDTTVFFDSYWERKPLILHREQSAYYQGLFSIAEVDQVLDVAQPNGSSLRIVKNQQPLPSIKYEGADGKLNLNQLYAAYADGYTININEIQRFWQPVKDLCFQMSHELSHHTVANMYLTPRDQKALLPHYDTHDVFVLQIHGEKHWKIYESQVECPALHSFQPIFQREQLTLAQEVTLCAGDFMYMPRGVPHEAFTTNDSSLHLTVGVHPAQWMDLITKSIQQLAFSKVALRKALPQGYLKPDAWTSDFISEMQEQFSAILEEIIQEANLQGAIHLLSEEFRNEHPSLGDGHFAQIDHIQDISLEDSLVKRDNMSCVVQQVGGVSRIVFTGNVIKGPAHIAEALQFIADSDTPFLVKDLPSMREHNKLKLAARLIRGGLLKMDG